jgi:Protein of unknown function (DUF3617)
MTMIAKRTAPPTSTTLTMVALLCSAAFLATASTALAAGVNVHPGKWEMSTTMDVQGRGTGTEKAPVTKSPATSRCIKPEDVKDSEAMTLAAQKDKRCTTTILSATSDRVAWSYECPTGSGSADYTYSGDSYEQVFQFIVHTKDGDRKTAQRVTAHRIGDC